MHVFFRCQVPFFRLVSWFCCCSVRPCPNETTVKSNEQWPKPVFICGIQGLCITLSFTDYQKPIVRILMNQSGFHDSCHVRVFVGPLLKWDASSSAHFPGRNLKRRNYLKFRGKKFYSNQRHALHVWYIYLHLP